MARTGKKTGRPVRLRAHGSGISQTLGKREAEIMEILWDDSPLSVRDVYEKLRKRRKTAYTTVMTILNRLCDKELLQRQQEGRAYLYSPTVSREEYCSETVRTLMDGLLKGFGEPVLSHFVDAVGDQDSERLDELVKIIEEKKAAERKQGEA